MNFTMPHESLSRVPVPLPTIPDALTRGRFNQGVPHGPYGCLNNDSWMGRLRRRRNRGVFQSYHLGTGPTDGNLPLMPLWTPSFTTRVPSPPMPRDFFPHGNACSCACRSISASFDRIFCPRPILIDTPTRSYTPPALEWIPPTIVEALRDVDTDPRWSVEPSLHTRCDICGGIRQPCHDEYKTFHDIYMDHLLYRMEKAIIDDDWPALLTWIQRCRGNFNMRDQNNFTLLHLAVGHQRLQIAQNLLKGGAYVNARTNAQYTPLTLAVKMRDPNLVRLLILFGANINDIISSQMTALALAICYNNYTIICMLLEAGANPNRGFCLHRATYLSTDQVALDLLNAGADPNLKDLSGRNALECAVQHRRQHLASHLAPIVSAQTLLDTWRSCKHDAAVVNDELLQRVRDLHTRVKRDVDAWGLPHDIERHIYSFLFTSTVQPLAYTC